MSPFVATDITAGCSKRWCVSVKFLPSSSGLDVQSSSISNGRGHFALAHLYSSRHSILKA